jgi:peptidoglycan/LPS O-acetylase OafA/YrhL
VSAQESAVIQPVPPRAAGAQRLDFLDALRGLAAVYVIAYHLIYIPSPNLAVPAWARLWAQNGGTAVTLFFVISAFSLFYTTPARFKQRLPWVSYATHRLFRIAPLFYLWIVLTIVRDHFVFHAIHPWWEIAASAGFVFNFIPTHQEGFVWASWTIGVEMLFYVVFPFIYVRVKNVTGAIALAIGLMLAWMLIQVAIDYLKISPAASTSMHQWFFPRFLPEFSMGAIAYFLLKDHVPHLRQDARMAGPLGLLLVLGATYIYVAIMQNVGQIGLPDNRYAKAVCCLLLVIGLSLRALKPLVNRVTVFLGKISYSVYLAQPTAILLLEPVYKKIYATSSGSMDVSVAFVSSFLLTLAVVIPVATLSYYMIEKPGIKLGKRVYTWIEARFAPGNVKAQPQRAA